MQQAMTTSTSLLIHHHSHLTAGLHKFSRNLGVTSKF